MSTNMFKVTIMDNNNRILNVIFILYRSTADYIAQQRIADGYIVKIEVVELVTIEA